MAASLPANFDVKASSGRAIRKHAETFPYLARPIDSLTVGKWAETACAAKKLRPVEITGRDGGREF